MSSPRLGSKGRTKILILLAQSDFVAQAPRLYPFNITSIGRFAVDREFVNIENSLDHFGPRWCPRSPRGAPRGPFLGQDGEEEPQGDHFCAKMVPKIAKRSPKGTIFGPR